jgi:hypothetical protein
MVSVNAGPPETPFRRKLTVQFRVAPPGLLDATLIDSSYVTSLPLTTVFELVGERPAVRSGSQVWV